jgi:tetratricopeptide (TPR) repeat protein
LRQKLLKTDPENVSYQSDVAMTLNNLGNLIFENGQKEEAKENLEKAFEILESLSKKSPENKELIEEINCMREKLEEL